jgi:hypothetical protein
MPRLVGHSPEINGQVFDLVEARVTVGRTPDNRIHIPDSSVSSHHAELVLEGTDYTVKDLDSTNGTRINGEKVTGGPLRRGDTLRLGNVDLNYESETEPVVVPLPPLHIGIPLDHSLSRGRPASFVSGATGRHLKKKEKTPWSILIYTFAALAIGAIGYAVFTLVTA